MKKIEINELKKQNISILRAVVTLLIIVFIGLFIYPAISHQKGELPPDAPTDLSAQYNSGSLDLTWSAPLDGGSRITTYYVKYILDGRTEYVDDTKSAKTFHSVVDPMQGSYLISVAAVNEIGQGNYSDPVEFVVVPSEDEGSAPSQVNIFSASEASGNVTLTWVTPDKGGVPNSYIINYEFLAEEGVNEIQVLYPETEHVLEGLKPGSYTFSIVAVNDFGSSPESDLISLSVKGGVEEGDLSISVSPSVSTSTNSATVTWGTSKSASSQVYYGATDSLGFMSEKMNTTPMVTGHSVMLSDLVPCTVYVYKVASFDERESFIESSSGEFITRGCKGDAEALVYDKKAATAVSGVTVEAKVSGRGLEAVVPPAVLDGKTIAVQAIKVDKTSVVSEISKPTGKTWVGGAYVLNAIEDATIEVTSFDKPVTVSIDYQNEDVGNVDPNTLKIWHYEDGAGWRELSSCSTVVNGVGGTVTCSTTSFSVFGLFGEEGSGGGDTGGGDNDPTPSPSRPSTTTGSVPTNPIVVNPPMDNNEYNFTKNLWVGIRDIEVRLLQKFLNLKGFSVATEGPGSPGQETDFFGNRTRDALIKFQEAYKFNILTPLGLNFGTGYFGPSTRNYINSLEN